MSIITDIIRKIRFAISELNTFVVYKVIRADESNIAGLECYVCDFRAMHFSQNEIDQLDLPEKFTKVTDSYLYTSKVKSDFITLPKDDLIFVNIKVRSYYKDNDLVFESSYDGVIADRIDKVLKEATSDMYEDKLV